MKITLKSFYIFVLLFLPALAYSAGNTYYVTQTGSGDPMSIAEFNALGGTGYAGDTFYFSGTFSTRITVNISGTTSADGSNDVKLDGWEGGVCTPVASDGCSSAANLTIGLTVNSGMKYLDIQDFQITSKDYTIPAFHLVGGHDHIRIKKNLVYDAAGRSLNIAITGGKSYYMIIEENRCRNFAKVGNPSENFNFDTTQYFLIKNNWVSMEPGVFNYCYSCNVAATHQCHNVLIENNEFDGGNHANLDAAFITKEPGQQSEFVIRFNKFHGTEQFGLEWEPLFRILAFGICMPMGILCLTLLSLGDRLIIITIMYIGGLTFLLTMDGLD